MNIEEVVRRGGIDDTNLLNLYIYGSRVYGNYTSSSDYDFIAIVKIKRFDQFSDNKININFYSEEEFQRRIDDHEISALECIFLPKQFILKQSVLFEWKLNLGLLRKSLSTKSSNSWVKSKKKLTIEKDYDINIGRKSMFHAFRIIDFGIQISTYGKIINYSRCNKIHKEIFSHYEWSSLFDKFKSEYNNILTEFRKLAPK